MKAIPCALLILLGGCSSVPKGAYYPRLSEPSTVTISHSLDRAAQAAGDDPHRYSFALVRTAEAASWSGKDATFYFSDALARLPADVVEPIVAHEVAHEVLHHYGFRQTLSLSISAGFAALGFAFPGVGAMDLLVNPLIVRAFTREQEYAADQKAVEILRAMGYAAPRRALARALTVVDRASGSPKQRSPGSREPELERRLAALAPVEPPGPLAATDRFLAR